MLEIAGDGQVLLLGRDADELAAVRGTVRLGFNPSQRSGDELVAPRVGLVQICEPRRAALGAEGGQGRIKVGAIDAAALGPFLK